VKSLDQLVELTYEFSRTVSRQWKDVFKEHGLSPAPLLVLRQIYREPGLTVSDIARRTDIAKSHVSRTVESLSRQGYVEKRPDPTDQRVLRIHPTPEVSGGLEPLRSEIRQRLARRLAALPEDEISGLIKAVHTLQSILADQEESN
jgi:DNA-binding MarR family transcriptional regulator